MQDAEREATPPPSPAQAAAAVASTDEDADVDEPTEDSAKKDEATSDDQAGPRNPIDRRRLHLASALPFVGKSY